MTAGRMAVATLRLAQALTPPGGSLGGRGDAGGAGAGRS
jgi:hypothetical protein